MAQHWCLNKANYYYRNYNKRKSCLNLNCSSIIFVLLISSSLLKIDDLFFVHCEDTEIVLDDDTSITNRSNTFYTFDSTNNSTNENITVLEVENEATIDDFWDSPPPPSPSPLNRSTTTTTNSDGTNGSSTTSSFSSSISPSTSSTTTFLPPMPTMITWSTLPPPFTNIRRTSPFTSKPKIGDETTTIVGDNINESEVNTLAENTGKIWKIVLHGTNMNSEELKMCNKTLIENHFKQSSRKKVARMMKSQLEKTFQRWNYRFSILVSSTSRNTMGKSLHGVWMSISINGVHYFITATHGIVDGPKIKEDQMEKIEYWAHVHAIASRNMTGYRRYNRIASKLKQDLDRFYGNGNVWSVVIVKNPLLVKAKIFEDPEYHIEFTRLNRGHYIIWRGGQNINDGSRNARDLLIPESDDNTLEMETEHEDYRNNIYLMMT